MSASVVINGWRQQTTDRRQIERWLAEARQLGFNGYTLHRVRQHYWLCCITGGMRPGGAVDIAIMLQQRFKTESQLLYLQFDAAQMVCVSWQDFELRNCIALSTDEQGQARFRLLCQGLAEQTETTGQTPGKLLLAGKAPAFLTELISAIGEPWENISSGVYLEEKIPAAARFRVISKLPRWQRQRLWLTAAVAAFSVGAYLTWLWWPAPAAIPVAPQVVQVELPGLGVSQLTQLQYAMHQLTALAGWRLQQIMLTEQGLQATIGRTYGLNQELTAQLDARWQVSFSHQEAQLQLPLAKSADQSGVAQPAQDYEAAQRAFSAALPDYLPSVRVQLAEADSDKHWRWQNLTLNITDFKLPELELLALLLRDAPVRLHQAHIDPGSPARSTIQLQFIARQHYPGGNRP
ncbi:hypothetical protein IDSA_01845 [Pseudidiomarina salinarum]|uniref:Uncharacterized protein n=1 Tax=Pseudidiomarina salinarum TaxID=435908 RepID=A0A094L9I1_9GAMM|nr:hypothetical protein [Pseudidiomarina salinarum]KFZ31483.1 hypothetical protein IDSA_01845 [Pseudidiomarina salinarum]RUO70755.1 hypothetical protein CWI79_04720 [Pseudidiomarina salinarum]